MYNWWLFLFVVLYFLVALVLPTVGCAFVYGTWAIAFERNANRWQRIMGRAMGLLLFSVFLWAFLLGLLGPGRLGAWPVGGLMRSLAGLLMALGTGVTLVAQRQMGASWRVGVDDRPTALITHGLYRWVRNPIFSGMLVTFAGFALWSPAPLVGAAWLLACMLIALQVRLEERHLSAMHGAAWSIWAAQTGRFLPAILLLFRAHTTTTTTTT